MSPTEGCCRSETKDQRRVICLDSVAGAILFGEGNGSVAILIEGSG